jgi:hypothetical protein
MSEAELRINSLLVTTLNAYEVLKARGSVETANSILSLGSNVAKMCLLVEGIENHKVFCNSCGRQLKNGKEIQFYNENNECINCEHGRDLNEER